MSVTATTGPAGAIWRLPVRPHQILVALFLIAYPLVATPFWTVQIGAQSLFLGVIALSLMFLAGYGGMVSLSQMTVAGVAGYMIAIFGTNHVNIGFGWPWWAQIPAALLVATVAATLIGLIAVRTAGIYTIMITLAIGVAFFFFTRQNYAIFNGFSGFASVQAPVVLGINWRDPQPFYYLSLAVAAIGYFAVIYVARSTFGLSLQASRDNARRMNALGFNVYLHRMVAHAFAGFIAALGGVLLVWMNGRISPGTIGIGPLINILVIAVLGGLRHPVGPFLGAIVFILLQNFAIDLIDRERFNTLIGLVFLAIVFVSPDGLLGLWQQFVGWARS
ncbi:MAG TPA: branched-chain amino acid ABC transporter permease, partial [Dongiaceae bacterium]|nr:branched-chain amino acid ABC transporter permease [Dongiaceae bacterium]